jgi:plasmid stabilization system protein ParE
MIYQIDMSSVAEAEADGAFLNLSQVTSIEQAKIWYDGLLLAIRSLSTMPRRCSLARESDNFSGELRQLLYGRGRNCHRIIFSIVETETVSFVRILHVRHAAQQTIGEEPQ